MARARRILRYEKQYSGTGIKDAGRTRRNRRGAETTSRPGRVLLRHGQGDANSMDLRFSDPRSFGPHEVGRGLALEPGGRGRSLRPLRPLHVGLHGSQTDSRKGQIQALTGLPRIPESSVPPRPIVPGRRHGAQIVDLLSGVPTSFQDIFPPPRCTPCAPPAGCLRNRGPSGSWRWMPRQDPSGRHSLSRALGAEASARALSFRGLCPGRQMPNEPPGNGGRREFRGKASPQSAGHGVAGAKGRSPILNSSRMDSIRLRGHPDPEASFPPSPFLPPPLPAGGSVELAVGGQKAALSAKVPFRPFGHVEGLVGEMQHCRRSADGFRPT